MSEVKVCCNELDYAQLADEVIALRQAHEKQNELLESVVAGLKEVGKNPMALMPALMSMMKGMKA